NVQGECLIYYSDGENASSPIFVLPYQRTTLDIKMLGVREKVPFSTVIKTDHRVTATLIHYDKGNALGENFTNIKSTRWGIAEGFVSENTFDYLSLFNPNDYMVEVEIKLHPNPWNQGVINLRIDGKKRASLAVNDFIKKELYPFAYGITMESTGAIVASMSRYDNVFGDGMLFMAAPNFGEASGYIAQGSREEGSSEFLDFLNINDFGINLSVKIHYIDGISYITKYYIGHNQWASIKLTEDVITRKDIPYSLEYEATNANYWYPNQQAPVIANFIHAYEGNMEGVRFEQTPHRYWEFAEGFRESSKKAVVENLYIFNPSESYSTGNVTIYYDDGINPTVLPFKIAPYGKLSLLLNEVEKMRDTHSWGAISYGIRIDSNTGVIPYFVHKDTNMGGSFALNGTGWD
ncbi:MAG: hypothetical protein HQK69_09890, partial [Desulfamplus sp.]|nr:hypothetical protein [Desulfamplus sp.]